MLPGLAGGGQVALAVGNIPGEALAHGVDGHQLGKFEQHITLASLPDALDELHHADLETMAQGAEHHAKGGRRLALALACMDNQQTLFLGLGGQDLVAGLAFFLHFFSVISVALGLGHEVGLLERLDRGISHQIHTLVAAVAGSPELGSPRGSISMTCASSSATGRCMTPLGTT